MGDDDDDWETDPDYEAKNTDDQWLGAKMEAAKIVTGVYVPEGPDAPDSQREEDDEPPPPMPSYMPTASAAAATVAAVPEPAAKAEPPKPPPEPEVPPATGKGVAMRFLVPSQAKAPPKLPPS